MNYELSVSVWCTCNSQTRRVQGYNNRKRISHANAPRRILAEWESKNIIINHMKLNPISIAEKKYICQYVCMYVHNIKIEITVFMLTSSATAVDCATFGNCATPRWFYIHIYCDEESRRRSRLDVFAMRFHAHQNNRVESRHSNFTVLRGPMLHTMKQYGGLAWNQRTQKRPIFI